MLENDENKAKSEHKKNKKLLNLIYYAVMAILAGVFLFAGYKLYTIKHNYDIAANEYKKLDETVKISDESTDSGGTDEDEEYFPTVDIDFDKLKEKNDDVIGWLYMPVLDITYPVMQGDDNDKYLHYTYEGTKNSSGSIFMDYQSDKDMTDRNTIIYGHNMKNGSMFGKLKKFNQDETLCDTDPYIYYFTEDASYKYRIFAYYITSVGSSTYTNMVSDHEYDKYIKFVTSLNQYKTKVENKDRANILTLSTCSGLHSNNRMIVQGLLIYKKDNIK